MKATWIGHSPVRVLAGLTAVVLGAASFAYAAERTGKQVVDASCIECHATGKGGAPRIGDRQAWIARVSPGLDVVVASAINGHGGMPARGGKADLTDAEVKSAIVYMMNAQPK